MENLAKIEALSENKEFVEKVSEAKSVDEIIKAFAEEGVDVTEEDLKAVAQLGGENGEIDEAALDTVSGGGYFRALWSVISQVIRRPIHGPIYPKR